MSGTGRAPRAGPAAVPGAATPARRLWAVSVTLCSRWGTVGADLLKLTREDVIQICGPADGIRLFNALKGRYVAAWC